MASSVALTIVFVSIAIEGLKHAFPNNVQYALASGMES
jgi:hypothetical protein